MKTLILTVGLPRSGKSTWAMRQGLPVVNPDSIRFALYGQPFIASAEQFVWATAKLMVQSLFVAGHDAVILDATNTTLARREDWILPKVGRLFRVFDTCAEVCKDRARKNDQDYLIPVIERMAMSYEPLTDCERAEHQANATNPQQTGYALPSGCGGE